jgi:hypothetical protein
MVKYFVYRIKSGEKTLDDVPEKWRDEVKAELIKEGIIKDA